MFTLKKEVISYQKVLKIDMINSKLEKSFVFSFQDFSINMKKSIRIIVNI